MKAYYPHESMVGGYMLAEELEWLYGVAQAFETIVEIGSFKGRSAQALASGCKETLYCVDHFLGSKNPKDITYTESKEEDIYSLFCENTKEFDNITVLKTDSISASKQFEDKSVDMVFIDGDHDYEAFVEDYYAWAPKAKKLICGHDYWMASLPRFIIEHRKPIVFVGKGSLWFTTPEKER